jgi:hypothetical protein
MKKHLSLFICLTLFISSMAQPLHTPKTQKCNPDWWEPDTITLYQSNGASSRYLFSYDKEKRSAEVLQYFENGQWKNSVKNSYLYDMQNNLIEFIEQIWESNQWIEASKVTYAYNAQNNITEELQQYWELNQWKNSWKKNYTYNAQNNLVELLNSYWEGTQWTISSKYIFAYFEQNTKIEQTHQGWEFEEWVNLEKETYIYDTQNNLLETLYQDWDNEQWESYWKETYSYDNQNNLIEQLNQYYEESWENVERLAYTYDTQNNLIERIVQMWWDEWVDNQINAYTYDALNNRTSETIQLWDWDFYEWEYEEKSNYIYDENNNAVLGFGQQWESGWVDGSADFTIYYNNMQSFIEDKGAYRFTASYIKPAEVSVSENRMENGIKVYPNPTTGELSVISYQFSVRGVDIYDIYGNNVLSYHPITSSSHHLINISHLPAGIYFLRAAEQTIKIVKQ